MEQLPPLLLDFEIELAHGGQSQRRFPVEFSLRGSVMQFILGASHSLIKQPHRISFYDF
jgi:hypothetical protein